MAARIPRIPHIAAAILAALALLATSSIACGGGDGDETTAIPGGADPEAATVIDEWAQRLSEGDIAGAAEYFAVPSVAENGVTLEIENPADARLFNESLPCGAELVEATEEGELTLATFRLTERPGPGTCGQGVGGTAQTEFRIADGLISEWRRVVPESGGGGEGTGPEAPSNPI